MARRSTPTQPPQPAILTAAQIRQGVARLESRLQEVNQSEPTSVQEQFNAPHVEALGAAIDESLARTFGTDTADYKRYKGAAEFAQGPIYMNRDTHIDEVHDALSKSKQRSIALLEQAIRSLNEHMREVGDESSGADTTARLRAAAPASKKVFVVHGHDGEPKQAVARFLEGLNLDTVILHEQANSGRTIIEKFEDHADVGFAVVLLTPDDEARTKSNPEAAPWARQDAGLRSRARQNVVFELGYFIGRLGRSRVCALKLGDVEVPSDISGVVYVEYDAGGAWRHASARSFRRRTTKSTGTKSWGRGVDRRGCCYFRGLQD
jgi:hypothetical protein